MHRCGKAFDHLGYESVDHCRSRVIARAGKIVLPGVGNFEATTALSGALQEAVVNAIDRQVPLLGICLGMQWMFESSQEAPQLRGLGLFTGECEKFPAAVKSPHVGWNQLQRSRRLRVCCAGFHKILSCISHTPTGRRWSKRRWADCAYGGSFSAAVERGQLFGVQFHPEKSGDGGASASAQFL